SWGAPRRRAFQPPHLPESTTETLGITPPGDHAKPADSRNVTVPRPISPDDCSVMIGPWTRLHVPTRTGSGITSTDVAAYADVPADTTAAKTATRAPIGNRRCERANILQPPGLTSH